MGSARTELCAKEADSPWTLVHEPVVPEKTWSVDTVTAHFELILRCHHEALKEIEEDAEKMFWNSKEQSFRFIHSWKYFTFKNGVKPSNVSPELPFFSLLWKNKNNETIGNEPKLYSCIYIYIYIFCEHIYIKDCGFNFSWGCKSKST